MSVNIGSQEKLNLIKFRFDEKIPLDKVIQDSYYYLVTNTYMIFLEAQIQTLESKLKVSEELIKYYEDNYISKIDKLQKQVIIWRYVAGGFIICFCGCITGIIVYCVVSYYTRS